MTEKNESSLDKLLAVVEALDPDKRQKEEAPPSDDELTEARKQLEAAALAALEGDAPDLASGKAIKDAIDAAKK